MSTPTHADRLRELESEINGAIEVTIARGRRIRTMIALAAGADALEETETLRALARRLAWLLVADGAECTCAPGDECPLCHAKRVLGDDMPKAEDA